MQLLTHCWQQNQNRLTLGFFKKGLVTDSFLNKA